MVKRKESSLLASLRWINLSEVKRWLFSRRSTSKSLATLTFLCCVVIVLITFCLLPFHGSSKYLAKDKNAFRLFHMAISDVEKSKYLATESTKINKVEENTVNEKNVKEEFEKQWFRMQKARVDWEAMIAPCTYINSVKNKSSVGWGKINETSKHTSFVEYMDIRPAGQFSRIFIRSKTKDGRNKTIGGDFWMVIFSGPANVTATVFDHENGSYEAIALLVDSGIYTIIAVIERTLCEPQIEPEPSVYALALQAQYIRTRKTPEKLPFIPKYHFYVWGMLDNSKIKFYVAPTRDNITKRIKSVLRRQSCSTSCQMIWTGVGRWIGKEWKPYVDSDDHVVDLKKVRKEVPKPLESLYIIGDSTNRMFAGEYFHQWQRLCSDKLIWKRCLQNRQNIFPLEPKKALNASAIKFSERYGNVSERFRFEIILDPIRRAFLQPGMNSSRSLIVLHYNQHLTKILKLSQWKRLVDELISTLRNRHELFGSKAKVLWKTMTAIGHKMPYYPIKGKFHTAFRVRLFDTYALSQICKAGFDIYDIYPMSASTLTGLTDRVHYGRGVFRKAMDALTWWYLSNDTEKTQNVCFEP